MPRSAPLPLRIVARNLFNAAFPLLLAAILTLPVPGKAAANTSSARIKIDSTGAREVASANAASHLLIPCL